MKEYKVHDNTDSNNYQEFRTVIRYDDVKRTIPFKEIVVQMNGVDYAIAERDESVIYLRTEIRGERKFGSSFSVVQAKEIIASLNACIEHAEKVRAEYLSR